MNMEEPELIKGKTPDQIKVYENMLMQNIRIMKSEIAELKQNLTALRAESKENEAKLNIYRSPPYLLATVIEVLINTKPSANSAISARAEDSLYYDSLKGSSNNENPYDVFNTKNQNKTENSSLEENEVGIVIKTSTRQTVFLPVAGLIDPKEIKPNDIIGVNKDTYIAVTKLPSEFDLRAKSMLLEISDPSSSSEKTLEDFTEIGGIQKQIEELQEAVVLPLKHPDRFEKLGVIPGKGALLFGPPGTGKTLLARAVAKQLGASFFKVAAPQLAQSYVGGGAYLVREIFKLARERAPAIIFVDEIDAIGSKRQGDMNRGGKEVMRTLLELLNQIDGFAKDENIKVIGATNRADILDPALMRSGRLDRKIEFKFPDKIGRIEILNIHSRKMRTKESGENAFVVNEVAQACTGFNGAQLRAVCVEAGMAALRKDLEEIGQNEFIDAIWTVRDRKKKKLNYFI